MQATHSGTKRPPSTASSQSPALDARPSAKRRHPLAVAYVTQHGHRRDVVDGGGSDSDSGSARMRAAVTQLHHSLLPPPAPAPPSLYDRALRELRLASDASATAKGGKPRKPTHVVRKVRVYEYGCENSLSKWKSEGRRG